MCLYSYDINMSWVGDMNNFNRIYGIKLNFEDYKAPLTNRDKTKKNDSRSSWCRCDFARVWENGRCKYCGGKSGPKARMKPGKFKED